MTGRDESGTVTVWMAGLSAVVIVMAGFALDVGHLVSERQAVAAVADAAALAGSSAVDREAWTADGAVALVPPEACALARARAVDVDRFECAVDGTSVRVAIGRSVPLTVLSVIHPDPVTVTAWSQAEARPRP